MHKIYNIAAKPIIIAPKNPDSSTALAPLVDEARGALPVEVPAAPLVGSAVTEEPAVDKTEVEFRPLVAAEVLLAVEFASAPVGTVVKY